MQLSEDGNYMWNGDEWVPVEQAPVISETEPVEVQTPETTLATTPVTTPVPTVVSTPAVTPMIQAMGGNGTSGLDFTRGFSTLKYGLAAFLSTILTVILILIVNGIIFYVALSGADDVEGIAVGFVVSMIICVLFNILAVTQVLTLVMGKGISDGLDKPG